MIRVGVDVGGTFTDIVLEQTTADSPQRIFVHKVSSTPSDQSVGVVRGVVEICRIAGVAPSEIDMVLHGTTVATNMVIERKGAEVGMITTRGFRDILHMARHKRPHNFSLQFDVPQRQFDVSLSSCVSFFAVDLLRLLINILRLIQSSQLALKMVHQWP